jgi:AcrR family transcriptional regulator
VAAKEIIIGNEDRRDRILDACSRLLLRYGYAKTTVSEIAAEAGISKGAIYLHFPSKEAMAEALIWREAELAQHLIAERLRADPQGGSFYSLYLHSLRVAADRPLLRAFYTNSTEVFGDLIRTLAPKFANAETRRASEAFIARYQSLGLIRAELDPKVVTFILSFMRYGLLTIERLIPRNELPDMDDVMMVMAEMLDRAFGTSSGDTAAGRDAFNQFVSEAVETGKSGHSSGEGDQQ